MKKFERSLKYIDQFKTKKTFNMSRWNQSTKQNDSFDRMGSKVGGFFTIFLYIWLVSYFTYLVRRMYRGVDDNLQNLTRSNDLQNGHEEIAIGPSNNMPSMELLVYEDNEHT